MYWGIEPPWDRLAALGFAAFDRMTGERATFRHARPSNMARCPLVVLAVPLPDPGQDLRALDPHRLQRVRAEAEQAQDRRRDLGRLDPAIRGQMSDRPRGVHDDRHVRVLRV